MTLISILSTVFALALVLPFSRAFVPLPSCHHPHVSSLAVSWWDQDEESREAAMQHNVMRTDLRNFLTQRSIQSFLHLCLQCRDPHTVKWLEDFGEWRNLESFHGTGGLNITKFPKWSSVLFDLMQQAQDVVVVSVRRRGKGHGGWSPNNPYLEERFVEFDIDIDPPSLAARILSVREHIAQEWVSDLETLKISNDEILDSYNEKIKQARDKEECETDGEYENVECLAEVQEKQIAFDRNGLFLLRNAESQSNHASSTLRRGSFDLLALLLTQESVHRVLREYVDAKEERVVSFTWFRDFYVKRVSHYFDGDGGYGRADDFLEELLLTPPSFTTGEDGIMGLVDPLRIAEDILAKRSEVATEWKQTVSTVKDDHIEVRKELLEKQMLKWGSKLHTKPEPIPEPATAGASTTSIAGVVQDDEIYGEFE